jgi:hypothetical protein
VLLGGESGKNSIKKKEKETKENEIDRVNVLVVGWDYQ